MASPRRPARIAALLALTAGLALGGAARAETAAACRTLLVVEKGDGDVAAIDVGSGAVLWRAPGGIDPHEIVVAIDGSRAFVSNYGGPGGVLHHLSVIDLPEGAPLPSIDLWPMRSPHGLAAHDGSIWFTAESSKAVGRYDLATGRVAWTLGLGQDRTHMIAVDRAGTIVTANANSGSVSIVEPAAVTFGPGPPRKDWKVTQIAVGEGPQGIDISPDGRTVWVMAAKRGVVSVIEVASKTVVGQVELPWKSGNRLKLTPDGRLALVASEQLVAIDTQTRTLRTLALGETRAEGIVIAPDGHRAFVALPAENRVAVVALPEMRLEAYIATGKSPDGLACAPASGR
ncbi:outer membrane protein assembly factor BamB family protein [Caulobacter sp. LARHSG274]